MQKKEKALLTDDEPAVASLVIGGIHRRKMYLYLVGLHLLNNSPKHPSRDAPVGHLGHGKASGSAEAISTFQQAVHQIGLHGLDAIAFSIQHNTVSQVGIGVCTGALRGAAAPHHVLVRAKGCRIHLHGPSLWRNPDVDLRLGG